MCKVELTPAKLDNLGCEVHHYAALRAKVVSAPHVVVAGEEVYLDAPLYECGQAPQDADKALRHNTPILKPEVEDVAHEVYRTSILSDHIQPTAEGRLGTVRL